MGQMATVSSKGQLVIPAALRKKYRLKAGSRVAVEDYGGEIRVKPNPYDALLALRGKYARYPLEEDLMEERRKWDERLESM
ncbi:MAG: AbrB/MazE/SpoVT family DNA-binding domain-containing protein [Terracidiphilus sp.]|jgi:AbrB family looped-hinge helix DNA binding protein